MKKKERCPYCGSSNLDTTEEEVTTWEQSCRNCFGFWGVSNMPGDRPLVYAHSGEEVQALMRPMPGTLVEVLCGQTHDPDSWIFRPAVVVSAGSNNDKPGDFWVRFDREDETQRPLRYNVRDRSTWRIIDRVEVRFPGPGGWDWRPATIHERMDDASGVLVRVVFDDPPTGHPSWWASPENVRPLSTPEGG